MPETASTYVSKLAPEESTIPDTASISEVFPTAMPETISIFPSKRAPDANTIPDTASIEASSLAPIAKPETILKSLLSNPEAS